MNFDGYVGFVICTTNDIVEVRNRIKSKTETQLVGKSYNTRKWWVLYVSNLSKD